MKRWIVVLVVVLCCSCVRSDDGYHMFTDKQRRAINATSGTEEVSEITQDVDIYSDSANLRPEQFTLVDGRGAGNIHGIRVRIYMTVEAGDEMVRTFHHSESLSEEGFPWEE